MRDEKSPERNVQRESFDKGAAKDEGSPRNADRSRSPRSGPRSPRSGKGGDSPRSQGSRGSRGFERGAGDRRRDSRSFSGERGRSPGDRGSPRGGDFGDRRMRGERYDSPGRGAAAEMDTDFTQLYVAGISRSVRQESLRRYFESVGEVTEIVIKSKYAFINFRNH